MIVSPAFVLKNYLPERQKVVILHKYLGKITCIYNKKDLAARLCTGSLLFCHIEKQKSYFEITFVDVISVPENCSVQDITFFHGIVLLCLEIVPSEVMVAELFDFLWYVFSNLPRLTEAGRHITMLRLFLLFDLLPENNVVHEYALQDPYNPSGYCDKQLDEFVAICWKNFYHERDR